MRVLVYNISHVDINNNNITNRREPSMKTERTGLNMSLAEDTKMSWQSQEVSSQKFQAVFRISREEK